MNIVDMLINKIISETEWPTRMKESGDIYPVDDCFPHEIFHDAPDLEVFQYPEPDTMEDRSDITEVPRSLLGSYTRMASPGLITLYADNIAAYWKSLLRHTQSSYPFLYPREAERILRLIVQSVYEHERFHYLCDFARRVFKETSHDRLHEEALAVAATWHWMNKMKDSQEFEKLHPKVRREIVRKIFQYRSPGYRDWGNYSDRKIFHDATSEYLFPSAATMFSTCGLDLSQWLLATASDAKNMACIARIRENNGEMIYGPCSESINPDSTDEKINSLVFSLVEKYLKDFVPGPLLDDFERGLRRTSQFLEKDSKLRHWVKDNTGMIGVWHGLRQVPVVRSSILRAVSSAVYDGVQMKISFAGKDEQVVYPLGLVSREKVLYLVFAYIGAQKPYVMALHHISSTPEVLQKRSWRDYEFRLDEYFRHGLPFDLDKNEPVLKDVELLFDKSFHTSLMEQPLLDAITGQAVTIDSKGSNGWVKVTGSLPNNMELRWWLRGFGEENNIRVIQPDGLRAWIQGSLFDQLTGLPTRIATNHDLDRLIASSQRTNIPFAVFMIDIDHFKSVNDTYDHAGGDTVLREVAKRLKGAMREYDVLGRWGGEEFLVAFLLDVDNLNKTYEDLTMERADNILKAINGQEIAISNVVNIDVTISIGVRYIDPGASQAHSDKEKIIRQADRALYVSKEQGRDRATLWNSHMPKD